MKAPTIIVYCADSADGDIPDAMMFAAAMVPSGPGTHWMATGPSPEAAREKLEKLWAKQFPDTSKRGAPKRKTQAETVDDIGVIL